MLQIGQSDLLACLETVTAIGTATNGGEAFELLIGFVFNRRQRDLDERERARLELIRPHLGELHRLTRTMDDHRAAWGAPSAAIPLTPREQEVLHWLAGGKTDRDIGDILGISPRTVHKHLQRIYEKLGVETRTAAVVRAMGGAHEGPGGVGGDGGLHGRLGAGG